MATITKADKVSENKADLDTTAPAVANEKPVEPTEMSKDDIARTITLLRYNLNEVYRDSQRRRPLFSKTTDEASARYRASVVSLTEFAESMTRL